MKKTLTQSHFFYLLLLMAAFLLFENSVFIQHYRAYLGDLTYISHTLHIPWRIMPDILYFLSAQLFLHFLFCLAIYLNFTYNIKLLNIPARFQFNLLIAYWLLAIVTLLLANQINFPNSQFAEVCSVLVPASIAQQIYYGCAALCLAIFGLTLVYLLKLSLNYPEYLLSSLFAGCIATILFVNCNNEKKYYQRGLPNKPNIILIGVDSLRPDYLSYFGSDNKTTFIDAFLNHSTVFADAVTPLARTFPSWVSILTGKYPIEVNARSNLVRQNQIDLRYTLPKVLQSQGYETIYASDETRFSNIDKNFGFDRIITPPMGLNDFLLGSFNDFPLSNLLINTAIGQIIFPYSYGNRAVFTTYDPSSFINLLDQGLLQQEAPLFLVTHFCLPHFPYLWRSLDANQYSIRARYVEAIKRVDSQIQELFNVLSQKHLLENALVILLSDHGEALELPGDRLTQKELYLGSKAQLAPPHFYPGNNEEEKINESAGHGTDVLGMTQSHILLAFKRYGTSDQAIGVVPGLVVTIDITPTILELLKLPFNNSSGISLANAILGTDKKIPLRDIFLESDYSPESIRTVFPQLHQVLLEGIKLFAVDPDSTRLYVKPKMEQMIIKSKQVADIYGNWMLAAYPQQDDQMILILINLISGQWTTDLENDFAHTSDLARMKESLKQKFKIAL